MLYYNYLKKKNNNINKILININNNFLNMMIKIYNNNKKLNLT